MHRPKKKKIEYTDKIWMARIVDNNYIYCRSTDHESQERYRKYTKLTDIGINEFNFMSVNQFVIFHRHTERIHKTSQSV